MKIKYIFLFMILVPLFTIQMVSAGPEELSEHQMTDVTVDDTITDGKKADDGQTADVKRKGPPSAEDMSVIKNPVDDPAELNKAEMLRLENRDAEIRVNEQLRNTLIGIPNEPGN